MQGKRFWTFVVIFAILSTMTIWQVHDLQNHVAFSDKKVGALSSALTEEQRNAERKGVTPVAPPATAIVKDPNLVAGPPGPTGPAGPQGEAGTGPTDAQVINATFAVLRTNPNLTTSQIKAAVAAYLVMNPPPAGINGKNGVNGKDGAPGPTGPTGAPGANGKDGTNGVNGTNGADGVGIKSVTWDGCVVTITLTDSSHSSSGSLCGPKGDTGATGPQGNPGVNAVPFTFTFVVPGPNTSDPLKGSTTYTCTITAPSTTAQCSAS